MKVTRKFGLQHKSGKVVTLLRQDQVESLKKRVQEEGRIIIPPVLTAPQLTPRDSRLMEKSEGMPSVRSVRIDGLDDFLFGPPINVIGYRGIPRAAIGAIIVEHSRVLIFLAELEQYSQLCQEVVIRFEHQEAFPGDSIHFQQRTVWGVAVM
jgi:hypothetical protein